MSVPRFIQQSFDHLRWADERALESLRGAASPPQRALILYAHLLAAEQIWLDRIRNQPSALPVWPTLEFDQCAVLAHAVHEGYAALLSTLDARALDREVAYRNTAGGSFTSRLEDILLHVTLHGAYHRGQIAQLLRQAGAEPAPTDYIAFVRGVAAGKTTG